MIKTFKALMKSLRGYKKDVIWTWFYVIIETFCEIMVPFFMQFLVDAMKLNSDPSSDWATYFASFQTKYGPLMQNIVQGIHTSAGSYDVYVYGAIMAGIALIAAAAGVGAGYWAASAASGFGHNLRKDMYYHIQDYSFNNIDKFSTSSIVTRLTTDVSNVQFAFQMTIRAVLRAPMIMIFAIIMSFVTSWKLALIFVVLVPVILAVLTILATVVHPLFVAVFNKYDELNQEVQEDLAGIRVVKAYGRQEEEKKKFGGISGFIYKTFTKAEQIMAFNSPLMSLLLDGAILLIAYFGAQIIIRSNATELTAGGLTTLVSYVMQIMLAVMLASMVYVMIIISRNSAERINEILDEQPDLKSKENAIKEIKDSSVTFENVAFHYGKGPNVLEGINLQIKPGESVGIVGSTGSSKTTLMSLIARLYDVTDGSVKVGGVDVRDYDLTSLRESVAVVLQKNTLFSGTIASNLRWGKADATEDEMKQACQIAQADEFIESFPDKYNTKLDEGGTNVSGGQKQRICIARALLKNPKILILDDSTSAVDTHTDALIREGLKKRLPGTTAFIVAERILSVKECDTILVMDQGKVVAQGTNDELMASSPIYKELYQSQLGGGDFDASR
jgi:ATP-binding cassette subfamily B multidrug efflux pump